MDDAVVIMVTASSEEEAEILGKKLVEERLVACANCVPGVRSIFVWQGELCDECEVLLIMKSQRSYVSKIVRRVKELHSYDVPEIIALPIIEGSEDYLTWIAESVS
jgi:periplasmic divalent cation tolerance protein